MPRELRHLRYFMAGPKNSMSVRAAARLHLSGQKHLYPFAVLLRELPAERRWNLLQRAQFWRVPLAERIARAARRQKESPRIN
jgi:hypothetical protein